MVDPQQDWALRLIPQILWEWNHFTGTNGNNIRYEVPGGQLEFKIRDNDEVSNCHATAQKFAGRRRAVLDQVPLILGEEWVFPKVNSRKEHEFA